MININSDRRFHDIGIYFHWPFCQSRCPYCSFNTYTDFSIDEADFVFAVNKEMEHTLKTIDDGFTVRSIFFGGGTPSLMSPVALEKIISSVNEKFNIHDKVEITIECNPTVLEYSKLKDFKQCGVNRISIGVQSIYDEDLRKLGRQHTSKQAIDTIYIASKLFNNLSVDLMFARPQQKIEQWQRELQEVLKFPISHLSLYQLTLEPNTPFFRWHKLGKLNVPNEKQTLDMLRLTTDMCKQNNFERYEISNYARDNMECWHNKNYWRSGEYIGIGPGAHGRIVSGGKRYATENYKLPTKWYNSTKKDVFDYDLKELLNNEQQVQEYVITAIRTKDGVDTHHKTFQRGSKFINLLYLKEAIDKGILLFYQKRYLRISNTGSEITNNIILELFSN